MNTLINSAAASRTRIIAFWLTTGIIALETGVGAIWDLQKTAFVRTIMAHLGYPEYILTIMGVWKVLGVIALLMPGFPRLKEWVYAGLFFTYTGAFASHLAVGQSAAAVAPLIFAGITMASWALRPVERRDFGPLFKDFKTSWRTVTMYWISTSLVVFVLGAGGVSDLLLQPYVVAGMKLLGYPAYFCVILGTWKVLGAVAITIPGYPRLKEWAYAGIIFDFTGGAVSHWSIADSGWKVILFLVFALISWALRPASRKDLLQPATMRFFRSGKQKIGVLN
ncbi:DoxX family protein [Chitinophaga sp.]|uniref:DoxX family protein n=1 Tax=Chitinophaga sp. TaxID=1869181 RepID=UPI002F927E93